MQKINVGFVQLTPGFGLATAPARLQFDPTWTELRVYVLHELHDTITAYVYLDHQNVGIFRSIMSFRSPSLCRPCSILAFKDVTDAAS